MAAHMIWKVDNKYNIDLGNWVGALGLAGQTAWNSFYGLVKPKKGETIWVNAASSTVGEIVVQLAKKEGMRVIGSVSSDEKAEYVKSLGADECFNYTKESCDAALKRLAPEGVDVVYENVGGDHFQAALTNMKWFGRIIVCGMVSEYVFFSFFRMSKIRCERLFATGIHVINALWTGITSLLRSSSA